AQTDTDTVAATVQPLTLAILRRDGRFTAGPANSKITATPGENPAARRLMDRGISRNVGNANGTAIVATIRMTARFAPGEWKMVVGRSWTMSIDAKAPISTTGTVRIETTPSDRTNWLTLFGSVEFSVVFGATKISAFRRPAMRSASGPIDRTAAIARSTRTAAIRGS